MSELADLMRDAVAFSRAVGAQDHAGAEHMVAAHADDLVEFLLAVGAVAHIGMSQLQKAFEAMGHPFVAQGVTSWDVVVRVSEGTWE